MYWLRSAKSYTKKTGQSLLPPELEPSSAAVAHILSANLVPEVEISDAFRGAVGCMRF
jgi:hypothetical protein